MTIESMERILARISINYLVPNLARFFGKTEKPHAPGLSETLLSTMGGESPRICRVRTTAFVFMKIDFRSFQKIVANFICI